MKLLNFGSCNLDFVYSLDHIVAPGETEASDVMRIFPGGKGLNQSIAAAKAGVQVFHAGCVGNDGQILTEILSESGVDTRYLRRIEEKNGHAIIQVTKDGENSIILYSGSNARITDTQIDAVLENFESEDILLLQNEINLVDRIVEKAYGKGIRVVLNPSPFNASISKINLNHIFCLILNEVEAKGFSGTEDARDSLAYFKSNYPDLRIMLTLGKQGCVYMEKGKQVWQEAFPVTAVDTTAAGDTFTGYFLAGLSNGMEMRNVLKMACAASAIAVTRSGAAPSIPDMAEVMDFLKNPME